MDTTDKVLLVIGGAVIVTCCWFVIEYFCKTYGGFYAGRRRSNSELERELSENIGA